MDETVDDVLLSVLNSKSIGSRFSRSSRNRSRLNKNDRLGSSHSATTLRPEGPARPLHRLKIDHDGSSTTTTTTTITIDSTGLSSPPPSPVLHYQHYHPRSTSKLGKQFSISTPELHSKVTSGHQEQHREVKPRAAREVDFTSRFDKENAYPALLHSAASSSSSSSYTLTSSSSMSHLHTIPSSSSSSSSSHALATSSIPHTPSYPLSASSSHRPPLREVLPPTRPHHQVEETPEDPPSSSSVPPHSLRFARRGRMLGSWTAVTGSTITPTPSPPQDQPTTVSSPTPPPPSVVPHRSTPLFRSHHLYNRSNTASEVNGLLGRSMNRSNTASEVSGVLGRVQNRSNTASEVSGVLGRQQNRSNTASEVNTALARPQPGKPTVTATPRPHTVTTTQSHTITDPHPHNTATTRHTHATADTHTHNTATATHTHPTTERHTNNQQTRASTNTASETLQNRTHTNTTPQTTHRPGEGGQANLRPSQDQPDHSTAPAAPTAPPPSNYLAVNGKNYLKLHLLGRGGSSKVFAVVDEESKQVRAMKVVNLENLDEGTLTSYKNEISMLERLKDCSRVIRLYDYEVKGKQLVLVMEKGSEDFAAILSQARAKKGYTIPHFTIQHYWAGMLLAVQQIHQHGIIHCDLKPANFLLVESTVKLIDFGIASSIQQDMTSVIKDSQAGTFNYMSPESLLDVHSGPIINNCAGGKPAIKLRVKSDVWSLGCILYSFVYGRTPFQHITNPLQKLSAISNPNTRINFPEIKNKHLMDVLRLCLQFDPQKRPSIEELLDHPLLTG